MNRQMDIPPEEPESPLGLLPTHVRLVPYSDKWTQYYRDEHVRLCAGLDGVPMQLVHIGSTSVPNLPAKPIIDILLGCADLARSSEIARHLHQLGYMAHEDKSEAGRQFFSAGNPTRFHLHLVELDGPVWKDHLLFRECLRGDPQLATRYVELKQQLAVRFYNDRESYTRGKADFIENALAAAYERGLQHISI